MRDNKSDIPDGYIESIRKGTSGIRRFGGGAYYGSGNRDTEIEKLRHELDAAEAIVIGAGAGLSTSAGLTYSGERFNRYLADFGRRYGFEDMYSGGFVVMNLPPEVSWAYWSRNIYINRYMKPPKPVYDELYELVRNTDYFVVTTNVDHCFQRAGFEKKRLFYTQGDYGLWQCRSGRINKTYDNEELVKLMLLAQGFAFERQSDDFMADWGDLVPPANAQGRTDFTRLKMSIPSELIPYCPENGEPMAMNLRADDSFVEDEGWRAASANYAGFLREHESGRVLYLELGVGGNTPVIIKFPFWAMTADNPDAVYACLNYEAAYAPKQIGSQSICIDGDTGTVIRQLLQM